MAIKPAKVSVVFPERMSAKVVFEDRQGVVSDELPIICQGSGTNYHYWLPDVGEQVAVAEADDGKGEGFILGSFYSAAVPPKVNNQEIRKIEFADGSFIEFNRADGSLKVQCTGNITINGATVNIN